KFATADYPGASVSEAVGDADNTVVGLAEYTTTSGEFTFTFKGGVYSAFTLPGAPATEIFDINSAGVITGGFDDNAGNTHGFTYSGGTVTQIDVPGATTTLAVSS